MLSAILGHEKRDYGKSEHFLLPLARNWESATCNHGSVFRCCTALGPESSRAIESDGRRQSIRAALQWLPWSRCPWHGPRPGACRKPPGEYPVRSAVARLDLQWDSRNRHAALRSARPGTGCPSRLGTLAECAGC